MDNRAIGIFDSGIGGLTSLKTLRALLPEENFIFFADTGRMPYGGRSLESLRRIAVQDMDLLAAFGVKAILSACGTISSAADAELAACPVPAFGVLRPALRAMADIEGEGALCVLATEASIRSGQFTEPLKGLCPGREIVGLACPEFAPMIEAGHIDPSDPVLLDGVARALAPIRGRRFDALLLGCTHYGVIEGSIRAFLGEDTPILSAADCGALAVRDYLRDSALLGTGGKTEFVISCAPEAFDAFASRYLEMGPVHARQVPVMEL